MFGYGKILRKMCHYTPKPENTKYTAGFASLLGLRPQEKASIVLSSRLSYMDLHLSNSGQCGMPQISYQLLNQASCMLQLPAAHSSLSPFLNVFFGYLKIICTASKCT